MSVNLGKRAFLRGRVQPVSAGVPLPWTTPDSIAENCTRCGECGSACPENIIILGDGGFPSLSFVEGECSFCGLCAKVCGEAVFDLLQEPVMKSSVVLDLKRCLPEKGIHCEICRDNCPESAITMKMRIGKPPAPVISHDSCTSCGACYKPCPAEALSFTYHKETQKMKGDAYV